MAGKYEAEGTGIHDWITRDRIYTGVIVLAAGIIAALITLGITTVDDIKGFIDLAVYLVGILAGVAGLISAALAKANVAPNDSKPAEYLD